MAVSGGYGGAPGAASRNRYQNACQSKIFEPSEPQGAPFVPAGKRRDQTTSEMFGDYDDKELRAMPRTFVPKDDVVTAHQKKQNFLSSDVLPHSQYAGGGRAMPLSPRAMPPMMMEADTEERIDPAMRRQDELASELFGRETPAVNMQDVHDRSRRLTPNDFKWFNIPEPVNQEAQRLGSPRGGQQVTYQDRAYHEKCSGLFNQSSPLTASGMAPDYEKDRREREVAEMGELQRKSDLQYSDLFGRCADRGLPAPADSMRPKQRGSIEDTIVVHRDWTDSKTELVNGRRQNVPDAPSARKGDEFNQTRIFGDRCEYERPNLVQAVTTDNSSKIGRRSGESTMEVHQAHLQSSMTSQEFYDEANETKHWEVVELHISGLRYDADEPLVKRLCQGFDLQIVKIAVEMDPVRNLCKGRAKIMVRYNPLRDTIQGLVDKLQQSQLTVEL